MDFADAGTRDIYDGNDTKAARRTLPRELWKLARRKLDLLGAAKDLGDLRAPPANRLEKLKGDRAGYHSIRINDRYRIVFGWEDGRGAREVTIVDYH